jgi:proteasome activator subunit 4
MTDALSNLTPESFSAHVYSLDTPGVDDAITVVQSEFGLSDTDLPLLEQATSKLLTRLHRKEELYENTLTSVLEVACNSTTHVGYDISSPSGLQTHVTS